MPHAGLFSTHLLDMPTSPMSPVKPPLAAPLPAHTQAEARKRSALAVRTLQRRARTLAEREYSARAPLVSRASTAGERKKRMRNKSAFISRQTQRHYERLLAAHVQAAERDRDATLRDCIADARAAAALRRRADELAAQLAALSAPTPPANEPETFAPRMSHILDEALEFPVWGASPLCAFE